MILGGSIFKRINYLFQYEFQGAGSRRLLDAYGDIHVFPFLSFKIGQYKEPFGLEQSTSDKNLFFAERSMGYYLTPQRDIGVMAHATLFNDRIYYGVGVFNGDGLDDTTGGDVDDPEVTGRLVFSPFKQMEMPWIEGLQVGGSASYANIDNNNVSIDVETTGLTTFFEVATRAKFNIIRSADYRARYAAELGWSCGPVAVMAEYVYNLYSDVQTSSDRFDIKLRDYYVALMWMITGEHFSFKNSLFQPIKPLKNLWQGGWGAIGVGFRYDNFKADDNVYVDLFEPGDSVQKAHAYTFVVNWYLNQFARLLVDFTRTEFDRPLLISRDALTGTSVFSDYENVLTGRFQLMF